jgi:hypothetical protein
VNSANSRLRRAPFEALAWGVAAVSLSTLGAAAASACPCEEISPAQGFERAQYVFTGEVVEQIEHTWTVQVDRVWKGAEILAGRVRLLDVYAGIDCQFYFEPGRSYLFFAIVAKSSRYVYYQPQACNLTSPLRSKRVPSSVGSVWLEDLIAKDYGPGEPPKGKDPWERLPAQGSSAQN